MNSNTFISKNTIRLRFTQAISDMYQIEVPQYKELLSIVKKVNERVKPDNHSVGQASLLGLEHHGAIRVGTAYELSTMRRLFAVMGMYPVDYYDLSVAGIPVHSTAFRALDKDDLDQSPFRVFCSLLRLDLIKDNVLKKEAKDLLNNRQIFPEKLLKLIELSEKHEGLNSEESKQFIQNALDVFRWHKNASVNKEQYDQLKNSHGLLADVISFKVPHINHLTPKVLDIDACQEQLILQNIKAKALIEGPPKRENPILLRQTSFLAIAENVLFLDGVEGTHTARFGEVEQRGIALTPKGRDLYDQLLKEAITDDNQIDYAIRLKKAFKAFPDDLEQIRLLGLGYFEYSIKTVKPNCNYDGNDVNQLIQLDVLEAKPIRYEDFLPVSAAGIFTSNLSANKNKSESTELNENNNNQIDFENALGTSVKNSFELYEALQQKSLTEVLEKIKS